MEDDIRFIQTCVASHGKGFKHGKYLVLLV